MLLYRAIGSSSFSSLQQMPNDGNKRRLDERGAEERKCMCSLKFENPDTLT